MNCRSCSTMFTNLKDLTRHAICQPVNFTCIACWLPLHTIPDVVQHIDNMEHTIMALATGIGFYTQSDNSTEGTEESFPPHNCCLLCSTRDLSPNNGHLKSPQHKYFVSLMKHIFRTKEVHSSEMPISFLSKLMDVKQSDSLGNAQARKVVGDSSQVFCELCNIYFSKLAHYMQHIEDESHRRMEQFIIRISQFIKGVNFVDTESHIKVSKTFSNSLIPLFYCELCSIWVDSTTNYYQHTKSACHRRIKELSGKLSNIRNRDPVTLRDVIPATVSHYSNLQPYCKLCSVQFSNHETYRLHLEASYHRRIEQFVNSLPSRSDQKFIHAFIDAQAHMKFNETPPPKYCEVCDILHFKSEHFIQHLDSVEHKQTEKYCLKAKRSNKDCFDRKRSKMRKASPEPLCSKSLSKKRDKSNMLRSFRKERYACCSARVSNASSFSPPGFDTCHVSFPIGYESDDTNKDYNFLSGLEAFEDDRFFRQQHGFRGRETTTKYPHQKYFEDYEREQISPQKHDCFGYRQMYYNSHPRRFDLVGNENMNSYSLPGFEDEGAGNFLDGYGDIGNIDKFPSRGFARAGNVDNFSPPYFEGNEDDSNYDSQEHYCEICDFRTDNPLHYDKHLMGDEHKKLRRILNKKGKEFCSDTQGLEKIGNSHPMQYNCELCDVFNQSYQEYEFHRNTPKHKKNQWLLYVFKQKCL